MGMLYEARCRCVFECRDVHIGGGMFTGATYGIPTACPACHKIWSEDEKSECRTCRTCGAEVYRLNQPGHFKPRPASARLHPRYPWLVPPEPSDAPPQSLRTGLIDPLPPIPSPFEERPVRYRCPGCGKFSLRLIKVGNWD